MEPVDGKSPVIQPGEGQSSIFRESANKVLDLKTIPVSKLIEELGSRKLTYADIITLQSLRPEEEIDNSKATIITESPKEIKSSVEKFAKEVIGKNVYGKLLKRVKIDGIQIGRDSDSRGANDFSYYGPDKTLHPVDTKENVWSLVNIIYRKEDQFPELVNSHIVNVAPSSPDAVNNILTIYFFQDRKAPDNRGYYTPAFVQVKLPDKATTEFLSEISINPDLLEEFYQKVFIGLDSKEGYPGMRRAEANGFYLIADKDLEEVRKACKEYDPKTGYDQKKRINTLFKNLGKHQYKNGPYGTGEAFQARGI